MIEQGGTKANLTGQGLEDFIESLVKRSSYTFVKKDKFKSALIMGQPVYTKQFPLCKSIYGGKKIKCDFILYHPSKYPERLVIEAKWQQTGGSVDEKFPYLVKNIKDKYLCETILILDGGGYKPEAEKWIKDQIGDNLKHVFSMVGFQTWVNNGGL